MPNIYCKLSGMVTEARLNDWSAADFRPYAAFVPKAFGPDRLRFGSDWLVCLLAGTWKEVFAACTQAFGPLAIDERERILGGTAVPFYRL